MTISRLGPWLAYNVPESIRQMAALCARLREKVSPLTVERKVTNVRYAFDFMGSLKALRTPSRDRISGLC